jgi:hypothetical protein
MCGGPRELAVSRELAPKRARPGSWFELDLASSATLLTCSTFGDIDREFSGVRRHRS